MHPKKVDLGPKRTLKPISSPRHWVVGYPLTLCLLSAGLFLDHSIVKDVEICLGSWQETNGEEVMTHKPLSVLWHFPLSLTTQKLTLSLWCSNNQSGKEDILSPCNNSFSADADGHLLLT